MKVIGFHVKKEKKKKKNNHNLRHMEAIQMSLPPRVNLSVIFYAFTFMGILWFFFSFLFLGQYKKEMIYNVIDDLTFLFSSQEKYQRAAACPTQNSRWAVGTWPVRMQSKWGEKKLFSFLLKLNFIFWINSKIQAVANLATSNVGRLNISMTLHVKSNNDESVRRSWFYLVIFFSQNDKPSGWWMTNRSTFHRQLIIALTVI